MAALRKLKAAFFISVRPALESADKFVSLSLLRTMLIRAFFHRLFFATFNSMKILWKYLKPQQKWVIISLLLAAAAQLLNLVDPIIFGKIIDDYAIKPITNNQSDLTKGVVKWLALAVGIAMLARIAKAFQDYTTRLAVQKFGMQIFNDGLKQTPVILQRI